MRGPLDREWSRIICVASGPSLSPEQKTIIRAECGAGRWRVIVCNATFRSIPEADVLFGADLKFWKHFADDVRAIFPGERMTADREAAEKYGPTHVPHNNGTELSPAPGTISTGGNSGHAIVSLAYALGAREIVLVGYDMQHTGGKLRHATGLLVGGPIHHHGPHPMPLSNPAPAALQTWAERLCVLGAQLKAAGVRVTNSTNATALRCFERVDLHARLNECRE